ncbi:Mitogen-activated protein kinase spm1 Short=MAP kinase spm1; AltName: Full=MAP kinase pmk1 [Serendipita indica DSM 11827]|nr:Mitogen-activated protein kinase spm1 Short=MAP kinase spm1; AltName: Full=MAP kinase pmk1 [Serendipita indica DSM 11827]
MSAPPSDSSPSAEINGNSESAPHSPPPDEIRGRRRTRELKATLPLHGYHSFDSMGRKFTVENRWKLVRQMGIGAFGAVVSAQDTISGEHVAIKQINRVYEKANAASPQLARRVLREITLLRHFQTHPNVTGLIDLDCLSRDSQEIYIFMEPMEADLHQIIRSGQDLSTDHIAYFTYQILSAINFIHKCNVIHRDLKPGNILVNSTCEVRICDFGLARGFEKYMVDGSEKVTQMTEYVATRWYRAPELMLGFESYDESIDVWSVGCILGELLSGKPIFPGKDYVDQLKCIFEYLGTPSEAIIKRIARGRARKYVRSLATYKARPFKFAKANDEALDLLNRMLCYEPERRITAADAMEHPWLAAFYDPEEEEMNGSPQPFTRWKEIEGLETLGQFREAIWAEIQDYRSQVRSLGENSVSVSPVAPLHSHVPILAEPIPEEAEPEEAQQGKLETQETLVTQPAGATETISLEPPPAVISRPETSRRSSIASIQRESTGVAIPRPRKVSQHPDPFATFSRRSSAIFGGPQYSPVVSSAGGNASQTSMLAYFPVLDETDDPTPSVAVPVRSRMPSMADGSHFRHLRTLSTVSIHENGARPGGLSAVAPIGRFIGAQKTGGADAPPSSPPSELR